VLLSVAVKAACEIADESSSDDEFGLGEIAVHSMLLSPAAQDNISARVQQAAGKKAGNPSSSSCKKGTDPDVYEHRLVNRHTDHVNKYVSHHFVKHSVLNVLTAVQHHCLHAYFFIRY
jgi:hypothetical protein